MKLTPIGRAHTPFKTHKGTPIQPACAGQDAVGTVEIFPPYEEGLTDLEEFERIWLLSWLDRTQPVRLMVTPYMDTRPHGLFATRAPARPNPIGLSAVRLLRREGPILHVAELDLLDGTPILDIKPYATRFDNLRVARNGWLDTVDTADSPSADDRCADTP